MRIGLLSMAKQKADAQNAQNQQLAQNLQNQNVAGQPQHPTLQLPQQPQQNKEEMSQETAEQILEAYSQDEKQLQEEMQRRKGGQRSLEKDW